MHDSHPTDNHLRLFVEGKLKRPQSTVLLRHLLQQCGVCRENLARFVSPLQMERSPALVGGHSASSVNEANFDAIFAGVLIEAKRQERSLNRSRFEAATLFEELTSHPLQRQLMLLQHSRKYRTWALCDLVVRRALRLSLQDGGEHLDLARLGVAIAEVLDTEPLGAPLTNDIRGRAWVVLGNALRLECDFAEAEEAFATAQAYLLGGTGDPLEFGLLAGRHAILKSAQRQFDEAITLLDDAIGIYRRLNDSHKLGRALMDKGMVAGQMGDSETAIELTRRGLELVDPAVEPRPVLVGKHNLVFLLNELGRFDEARAALHEVRNLHRESGAAADLVRLQWVEAKILQGQGDLEGAEASYSQARNAFVERQDAYDAALVTLDLAALYLEQARTGEMKALAAEMMPIFRSLQIPRETFAAMALFAKAVEMERITAGWIGELASYLQRARNEPGLEFKAPA